MTSPTDIHQETTMFNLPATRRGFMIRGAALGAGSLAAGHAWADWTPTKPIELLISFPPGGTADVLGRMIGQRLTQNKGWTVVANNRPGGAGIIMHRALQAAKADGHTIGLCASYDVTYPSQERGATPADINDFTYIAGLARSTHCLVARPDSGLDTIDKIRAYAKRKGSISVGVAAPFDWLAKGLGQDLGINAVGVPFKGGAEMMQQLMGGHLDLSWSAGSHGPLEKAGKVVVVVALTQDRLPTHPSIPSMHEMGGKLIVESRYLIIGQKDMPRDVADTLTKAIGEVAMTPAMQADVANRGLAPSFLSGAALRQSIEAEAAIGRAITPFVLGKT